MVPGDRLNVVIAFGGVAALEAALALRALAGDRVGVELFAPETHPPDAGAASRQTTKRPICRSLSKPSDGLEPSTPSLPFRFHGGKRGYARVCEGTNTPHIAGI